MFGNKKGFTLVELAIVMTIIGLLIGGVLKGQEMLNNARISAQIKQFTAVSAASVGFIDRFRYKPGDFPSATSRIVGCTASANCYNGDGNNVIGVVGAGYAGFSPPQAGTTTAPQVETTMFWKHLLLADLITGTVPDANPNTPIFGETHPVSPLSGGLLVGFGGLDTGRASHWLLLNARASGGLSGTNGALTPLQAQMLDTKVDDGRPNTGDFSVEPIGNGCKTSDAQNGVYGISNPGYLCLAWYRLSF